MKTGGDLDGGGEETDNADCVCGCRPVGVDLFISNCSQIREQGFQMTFQYSWQLFDPSDPLCVRAVC